jgi:hypothetical protein
VTAAQAWPWALSAVTLLSVWVIGLKRHEGWLIGLAAEVLWAVWSVLYHEWGFLVSAGAFSVIYARNWWLWRSTAS